MSWLSKGLKKLVGTKTYYNVVKPLGMAYGIGQLAPLFGGVLNKAGAGKLLGKVGLGNLLGKGGDITPLLRSAGMNAVAPGIGGLAGLLTGYGGSTGPFNPGGELGQAWQNNPLGTLLSGYGAYEANRLARQYRGQWSGLENEMMAERNQYRPGVLNLFGQYMSATPNVQERSSMLGQEAAAQRDTARLSGQLSRNMAYRGLGSSSVAGQAQAALAKQQQDALAAARTQRLGDIERRQMSAASALASLLPSAENQAGRYGLLAQANAQQFGANLGALGQLMGQQSYGQVPAQVATAAPSPASSGDMSTPVPALPTLPVPAPPSPSVLPSPDIPTAATATPAVRVEWAGHPQFGWRQSGYNYILIYPDGTERVLPDTESLNALENLSPNSPWLEDRSLPIPSVIPFGQWSDVYGPQ